MADATQTEANYVLDDQIGYILRLASQRHALIFQKHAIKGLTPTQFTTILRIHEHGEISQNHLGRLAAMDVATIKGVVDRLRQKNFVASRSDPIDKRRSIISLTPAAKVLIEDLRRSGRVISEETMSPLDATEQKTLVSLLKRIT